METETVIILITIVGSVLGSTLTTIRMLENRIDRLEDKIGQRLTTVDEQFKGVDGEFKRAHRGIAGVGERLARMEENMADHGRRLGELRQSSRERGRVLSEVRERLARVEGHLMGPESFRIRGPRPAALDAPSSEDPDPDQRQAG